MKPGFYPKQLPDEIIRDSDRNAEVRTFNALKKGMPPDYHIFYSCDWLDTRKKSSLSRDGECDFIIAHKDLGILFIEVKGGELGRDGQTGEWYRITGDGKKKIKDPVKQARNSKHVTLQLMREHWPKGKLPYLRLRHGVVLPHSSKPKTFDYLGAHMPISMFAFAEDMEDLPAKMLMMLLEKEGELENNYGKPGPVGINLLHKFFTSSFEFTPTLSSTLDAYDKRISEYTDEQKKILEFTSLQTKALILGGAGTGKTYLAHTKALEFATNGLETLLLYYNLPITQETKRRLDGTSNLYIKTFHELCREAATEIQFDLNSVDKNELFEKTLPAALENALSLERAPLFDAIIIDEAQDLRETWLETLSLCLKNLETGKIFVFADDNQNLYKRVHDFSKILECDPLTLTKNVRNTDRIFSFAQNFYSGVTSSSFSFEGPEVRFEPLSPSNQGRDLLKLLLKLRDSDGIQWKNIAVLSMKTREKSEVFTKISDISVPAGEAEQTGKVVFDSVWRFKGLERQVVIIVDIASHAENRTLQYVAATRARTLLIFCGPRDFSERYASLLKH